jgi:hypothetical protein
MTTALRGYQNPHTQIRRVGQIQPPDSTPGFNPRIQPPIQTPDSTPLAG